jgi:methylated-DNA-[protein]-cysteine S-methyltransferase
LSVDADGIAINNTFSNIDAVNSSGPGAHRYSVFETTGGFCGIAWNGVGITRFQLPTHSAQAAEGALLRRVPGSSPGTPTARVSQAIATAQRYFGGKPVDFSDFALDLSGEKPFFQQIFAAVRRIGWGKTTTYGSLAQQLGAGPEAARDVGQAMARNPVPLIIPCHRVLAAGGKLGGFSAPGGKDTKRRMLELEGILVEPSRPTQQSLGL